MKPAKTIILLLLLSFAGTLCAQRIHFSPRGFKTFDDVPDEFLVKVHGVVIDSLTREPLPDAVITIAVNHDVRYQNMSAVKNIKANEKGEFSFKEFRGGEFSRGNIEVSHLGYKLRSMKFDMSNTEDTQELTAELILSSLELDEIVVKTRLEMYKTKGDTIVYFPAAVKTMAGDAAIEILRAMPGVEVLEDGNIKIGGKQVERTYINNELLFGHDPRTAFKYLIPGQLASIEAYDEVVEDSEMLVGEDQADRRKVLNIKTHEKLNMVVTAQVAAHGGTDFQSDIDRSNRLRYSLGGEVSLFKNSRQIGVSGATANTSTPTSAGGDFYYSIGGPSIMLSNNGYNKANRASASFSGQTMNEGKREMYSIDYNYDDRYNSSKRNSIRDYFPSPDFTSRAEANSSSNVSKSQDHSLRASYNLFHKRAFSISGSGDVRYGKNTNESLSTQRVEQNNELQNEFISDSQSKDKRLSANARVYGMLRLGDKYTLNMNGSMRYSNNDVDGFVVDSSYVDQTYTYLKRNGDTPSHNVRGGVTFAYNEPDKKFTYSIGYSVERSKENSDILAVDKYTGVIDTVRSQNYRTNNLSHNGSLNLGYGGKEHMVGLGLDVSYTKMKRDEEYMPPGLENLKEDFLLFRPSLTYRGDLGDSEMISAQLSYTQNAPSLSTFSDKLDASNPSSLRVGNPDLKLPGNTSLNLSYDKMGMEKSMSVSLQVGLMDNEVISINRFFGENTFLEEYNYEALKGSSLSTYANGGKTWSISPSFRFGNMIPFIKSRLSTYLTYTYTNPQAGVSEEIIRTQRHATSLNLNLMSNFSRVFRFSLGSNTRFTHNKNQTINNTFNQSLTTNVEITFLKHAKFYCNYGLSYMSNSANKAGNTDSHELDLSLSWRIFKNRKGTINVNAYDVLSTSKNFHTSVNELYTGTTWNQLYSSYFTVGFEYRFNSAK